jgi:hypothetical protein
MGATHGSEAVHQLPLSQAGPYTYPALPVHPNPPQRAPQDLSRRLLQLSLIVELQDDAESLRLLYLGKMVLLSRARVLVSTTTITETMNAPQSPQRTPMTRPSTVYGQKSP